MKTFISDIKQSIVFGDNDDELNVIISAYLSENNISKTVAEWRIENYSDLRRWAYPYEADYLDAQVKIAQGGSLALEGQAQLSTYFSTCYAVKLRFPIT